MVKALQVGFDAREMYLDPKDEWTSERRNVYLLKQEVPKPLSTDTTVWKSVFEDSNLATPNWRGPVQDLWDNLEQMQSFINQNIEAIRKPFWTIAVTRFVPDDVHQTLAAGYQINPVEVAPGWELLGYDVSDTYLLSGLSNCGYDEDELSDLRAVWVERLNDFHLFTSLPDADQFAQLTDKRVREHAPFFVYALYLTHKYTV